MHAVLGRIDLNISKATRKIESIDFAALPVDDKVADDPTVAAVVAQYEKKLSTELDKPVGNTSVLLDAKQQTNRNQESIRGALFWMRFAKQQARMWPS